MDNNIATNILNIHAPQCPVCSEVFNIPKVLLCGHSLCVQCCQNLTIGNIIQCQQCGHETRIGAAGLATYYALQHHIDQLTNPQQLLKPYECSECNRPCGADEAWIKKIDPENAGMPYCYPCIIKVSSDPQHPNHELLTPASMESIGDVLINRPREYHRLKMALIFANSEQREWSTKAMQMADSIHNQIINANDQFFTNALDRVYKVESDMARLNERAGNLRAPESLAELADFKQSFGTLQKEFLELRQSRQQAKEKVNQDLVEYAQRFYKLFHAGTFKHPKEHAIAQRDDMVNLECNELGRTSTNMF